MLTPKAWSFGVGLRQALRCAALAGLSSAALCCKSPHEAELQVEAAAVVHAIDAVRGAPHNQKTEPLATLAAVECTDDEVCQIKEQCSQAYDLFVKGLEQVATMRQMDRVDPSVMTVEPLLESERNLKNSRALMLKCSEAEARLKSRFRL